MNKMKLTPLGKIIIFIGVMGIAFAGIYFGTNKLSFLKTSKVSSNSSTSSTTSKNSSSSGNDPIRISLDEWIGWKSIIDANGGLTTKKDSIYDKLGLKVEITIINDATQSSNALISNELDGAGYTINRYSFLYGKFKDAKVDTVMPYITNSSTGGDGIISYNINSIENLVGKKVAVPRFSEALTMVYWLVDKSSLSDEDKNKIYGDMVSFDSPDTAAAAFFAKQVDAAATWQPYLTQAQSTTGANILFDTKSAKNIILDGIVFRTDYAEKNPESVAKFIEGSLKAKDMYTTEFESIKNSMPLFATEDNNNIKSMTSDATLSGYSDNEKLLSDVAPNLFSDMSVIWEKISQNPALSDDESYNGFKSYKDSSKEAFTDKYLQMIADKPSETAQSNMQFTEESRDKAKNVDNANSLLKQTLSIEFEANLAVIKEESYESLNNFTETAKILDGAIIQIEGNCALLPGENPDDEGYIKLSTERAKSVAQYLQSQGLDPSRFVIVGNGAKNPVAPNDTEEGMKQNRRTDLYFKLIE